MATSKLFLDSPIVYWSTRLIQRANGRKQILNETDLRKFSGRIIEKVNKSEKRTGAAQKQ